MNNWSGLMHDFAYRIVYRKKGSNEPWRHFSTWTTGDKLYLNKGAAKGIVTQRTNQQGDFYEFKLQRTLLEWEDCDNDCNNQ